MPKTSACSPLDGLLDLACRDGVDIRPTLLRVLTDLYVQKAVHTADEETQYVELALGLIGSADQATRAAVVAALRGYPGAPRAVLDKLGAPAAAAAPAPKSEAPPQPARDDLTDLFLSATPDERRLILANIDVGAAPPRAAGPASAEAVAALERAALQRNSAAFSRALAGALGVSPALAQRITTDASGEPLVVAARALGMKAAVLQRILLCLDPSIGQSVARVFDLAQLFDELSPEAARTMAAIWQGQGKRARPPHEPATWDDERRSARSAATTRAYRAPRATGAPAGRARNTH
ncbi:MAG: DUF2336 domain-containing protein [Pseudolabrys sp.]